MHASTGVCVCVCVWGRVKYETVQHNSLCTHLIVRGSEVTSVQRFEQTSSQHLRSEEWGTRTNIVRV